MKAALTGAALMLLAGCSGGDRAGDDVSRNAGERLEAAAIATGVIPNPETVDLTGLYARDTERICVVPAAQDFRIGVSLDYGDGQRCSAAGTVARDGETLHVTLGDGGCRFDARLLGTRIELPGALPKACDALCSGRATLAGLSADRLSDSPAEAAALRDARGRLLCGG